MTSQSKSPPDDANGEAIALALGFDKTAGSASQEETAASEGAAAGSTAKTFSEIVGLSDYAVSKDGSIVNVSLESKKDGPIHLAIPTAYLDGLMSVLRDVRTTALQAHRPDKTVLSFRSLKSWAVAAYPGHDSVLLLLDGETPLEVSYALAPKAAKELADALDTTSTKVTLAKPRADH